LAHKRTSLPRLALNDLPLSSSRSNQQGIDAISVRSLDPLSRMPKLKCTSLTTAGMRPVPWRGGHVLGRRNERSVSWIALLGSNRQYRHNPAIPRSLTAPMTDAMKTETGTQHRTCYSEAECHSGSVLNPCTGLEPAVTKHSCLVQLRFATYLRDTHNHPSSPF
jgi:hypothetical protein